MPVILAASSISEGNLTPRSIINSFKIQQRSKLFITFFFSFSIISAASSAEIVAISTRPPSLPKGVLIGFEGF
jgi:hypothetical protein